MTSSSSVRQAREALGKRLREMRKDSGLTARELAARVGWHESKCSRIENGRTGPSDDDLRVWALHCGAEGQTADLIATARNIDGAYVEWRRMERSGLRRAQESVLPLWERTRHFRAYSSWLIPGPFQTRAYIEALLRAIRDRRGLPDDLEEAVQVRVDKQRILYEGPRRFAVILEESALRHQIGGAATMAGQLGHLLSLAALPHVSLGVIPLHADRTALWPVEDFWIFDEAQVSVELVAALLTITQPHEISMYAHTFAGLAELAVYGAPARTLLTAAIDSLG
ncbi:helix-turn-helix transcriptional regulator [Streptomyces sp. RPA4-5]|uniref:helix-turn-helix domain-containing protein n=1 Tax=Streptomyces TaxID=1883 RepID=UPI00143E9781|nr:MULTISPECIES: helix-turn-helix transcriptional regulator [Streptomyces]MCX4636667.1 helix-turn-helix transcriptional regulator [Streptomyces platensis]QIY57218.1 helix-turn-helix transcriptional regulator [Streptomyces sp. RPA4-5]WJY40258.1 helix-turn-helix transcriptional regulator [Streptomyces sp. P9-2B-2]